MVILMGFLLLHGSDSFLVELGSEEHFTEENLVICCLDLFTAGQEHDSMISPNISLKPLLNSPAVN